MTSTCSRCASPATAIMSYDYAAAHVWLDDHLGPIEPGTGYAMCEGHAARVTPPRGWLLTDRRSPVRPLFVTLEVA